MSPTSPPVPDLFTPIRIGRLTLPNRIVMSPMTRSRADENNAPRCMNVKYYRQRSSAGLIISEAAQVSPQGVGYPGTPGIHSYEQVAGWRRVTDAVHEEGGYIFMQLWHVGRVSHPSIQPGGALPVAPSAIAAAGEIYAEGGMLPMVTPRALSIDEMPGIVEQFRLGAQNALAAGFDGIELHAASGYLIDQFLRDGSNRRTDSYGGSVENRARLLFEIFDACAEVWGRDRTGVRISPVSTFNDMKDSDPDATFGHVAAELSRRGAAFLDAVENGGSYDVARVRAACTIPYMANGDYDFARATQALKTGAADLVSFGRWFVSNPDLPERFRRGAPIVAPDPATYYGGDHRGYTDYPPLAEAESAAARSAAR
jgi:N-ethylmaleimide reductase